MTVRKGRTSATQVKTPHIDRLAREGQRFENGYASAAVCAPTRYSLIVGQYSWRNTAEDLNKGVAKGDATLLISTTITTAPGLLKEAGYSAALIGKWHLGFDDTMLDCHKELRPTSPGRATHPGAIHWPLHLNRNPTL